MCLLFGSELLSKNRKVIFEETKIIELHKSVEDISSVAHSCPTLCYPMDCSMPGLPVNHQLPKFTQTHVHRVGDAIQPSSLLLLPSIFLSIRVFSNESVLCIRWPRYWRFSFSISTSNEYSGLISFRMDWLDPLTVQQTLKSLFQHPVQKHQILSQILGSQKKKRWRIFYLTSTLSMKLE